LRRGTAQQQRCRSDRDAYFRDLLFLLVFFLLFRFLVVVPSLLLLRLHEFVILLYVGIELLGSRQQMEDPVRDVKEASRAISCLLTISLQEILRQVFGSELEYCSAARDGYRMNALQDA
jgi:hypothetical protein